MTLNHSSPCFACTRGETWCSKRPWAVDKYLSSIPNPVHQRHSNEGQDASLHCNQMQGPQGISTIQQTFNGLLHMRTSQSLSSEQLKLEAGTWAARTNDGVSRVLQTPLQLKWQPALISAGSRDVNAMIQMVLFIVQEVIYLIITINVRSSWYHVLNLITAIVMTRAALTPCPTADNAHQSPGMLSDGQVNGTTHADLMSHGSAAS